MASSTNRSAKPMSRNPVATRHKLLSAAAEEVLAHGSAALRVDEVAKKAGVNKRMIYHFFGDRAGLAAAVFAVYADLLCKRSSSLVAEERRFIAELFIGAGTGAGTGVGIGTGSQLPSNGASASRAGGRQSASADSKQKALRSDASKADISHPNPSYAIESDLDPSGITGVDQSRRITKLVARAARLLLPELLFRQSRLTVLSAPARRRLMLGLITDMYVDESDAPISSPGRLEGESADKASRLGKESEQTLTSRSPGSSSLNGKAVTEKPRMTLQPLVRPS
tara:strand:- start:170 stop:1015 length:846 start_codon:yes stop_codon:yes gene_type:complete